MGLWRRRAKEKMCPQGWIMVREKWIQRNDEFQEEDNSLRKIWGQGERMSIEDKHSLRRRSRHMGFIEEGMGLGRGHSLRRRLGQGKDGPKRSLPPKRRGSLGVGEKVCMDKWEKWCLPHTPKGDGSLVQPIMGPWDYKRSWVQTQWCVGETLIEFLPLSLICECQQLVNSNLLLCFKRKKEMVPSQKKKKLCIHPPTN